ncbi:MAG TPA: hypothetical protein VGJ44_09525 [Kribbellaceae bacterium]|jgi:hypothetical protein
MLVLDSGGVSRLANRQRAAALVSQLIEADLWPPHVPTVVLVECLAGHPGKDAATHRLLKDCIIDEVIPPWLARRAAHLRTAAGRGSAVDAVVVASAEPGGAVLTSDPMDLGALASSSSGVRIVRV